MILSRQAARAATPQKNVSLNLCNRQSLLSSLPFLLGRQKPQLCFSALVAPAAHILICKLDPDREWGLRSSCPFHW